MVTILGWLARSWAEVLLMTGLGGLGLNLYAYWLARTGQPGWHKSYVVEWPLFNGTVGLLYMLLVIVVVASAGHGLRKNR